MITGIQGTKPCQCRRLYDGSRRFSHFPTVLARPSLKTWSCLQGLGWRAPARCLGRLWKGICGPYPLYKVYICGWWLRVPSQGYHDSPWKVRAHSTDVLVMYLVWLLQNNSSRHSKFQKLMAKKKKRKKQSPSQLSPARHLLQLDSTQDRDACTKVASRAATWSRWAEGVAMFDADMGQMEEIQLTTCYLRKMGYSPWLNWLAGFLNHQHYGPDVLCYFGDPFLWRCLYDLKVIIFRKNHRDLPICL